VSVPNDLTGIRTNEHDTVPVAVLGPPSLRPVSLGAAGLYSVVTLTLALVHV
jgi:hypothetical protein